MKNYRLIDADELLDRFANVYFCLGGDRPTADMSLTYHSLCNAVKRAPTVEQPTGEWIDRNGNTTYPFWERYECSICHKHSDNSNFCPNCGAKMKGDVKNEI